MGLGFGANYFLKLDELKNVKVSVEDVLQKAYTGDRDAFFKYIGKNMGLSKLTADEKASIVKAMDLQDKIKMQAKCLEDTVLWQSLLLTLFLNVLE